MLIKLWLTGVMFGRRTVLATTVLGKLRQKDEVISARRALVRAGSLCHPIMLDLHKLMDAISRTEVDHDGHAGHCPRPHDLG